MVYVKKKCNTADKSRGLQFTENSHLKCIKINYNIKNKIQMKIWRKTYKHTQQVYDSIIHIQNSEYFDYVKIHPLLMIQRVCPQDNLK